jgi:hypothetical protein
MKFAELLYHDVNHRGTEAPARYADSGDSLEPASKGVILFLQLCSADTDSTAKRCLLSARTFS